MVGVKGNSDGAPEASCPDMLPVHTHLGAAVSNVSCGSSCPALEVVGFQGNNTFTYACGRAYTCKLQRAWRSGVALLTCTHNMLADQVMSA